MVKHLDFDYEVDRPPQGFIPHFWDTIQVLGGGKGIILLCIGIILFYMVVNYVIVSGRQRREAAKKKQRKTA